MMNTKLRYVLLAFLMAFGVNASAQTFSIKGELEDKSTGEKVSFATISATKSGSKTANAYTLSDDNGLFTLEKLKKGTYTIKAELLGFKPFEKEVKIESADLDLGKIKLDPDTQMLEAAKISSQGNPIQMKQDTIEFTASTFKTMDNDVLEDLLKKIPGMEVSENGTITHNGRTINKITIDGKTFFLDDPQLASKNIPAKAIEKLKVVEKKSDQAQFTGIDDGKEETIIDLSMRPGMMNGLFGNVMAGGGHDVPSTDVAGDWRYQGTGFVGRFTDKNQISVILNGNNTNNRGFNDLAGSMMGGMRGEGMGRGQGGWGSGNGISTTAMAGANAASSFFDGAMDLGGNYLYNYTNNNVEESSDRITYLEGENLLVSSDGMSVTNTGGHRVGIRLEHKFSENTSILFQPQINFGKGDYSEISSSQTRTYTEATDLTTDTNKSEKNNSGQNKNLSTSGFFLLRQKLGAPGRTMTVMGNYSVSTNNLEGLNTSSTTLYDGVGGSTVQAVNQSFDQNQNSYSLWGNATFTQPIGGNFYVEANYSYSWNKSESDKTTIDVETGNKVDSYSNSIVNEFVNQEIGVNGLYQGDGFRFQLGFTAKPSKTHNYTESGSSYKVDTTLYRMNWAPQAMAYFDIGENGSFRMFYRGSSQQPNTRQLISVADNSNPLSVSFGNPNLAPYFNHSMHGDVRYNNKKTYASFNARWDASYNEDPIVNAMWYTNGVAYSMPLNGPASYSANINFFANVPLKNTGFTIGNMTRLGYNHSASYVGSDIDTGKYIKADGSLDYNLFFGDYDQIRPKLEENKTNSFSIMERLRVSYRSDNVEVELSGRTRINHTNYQLASTSDQTTTFNNQVRANVNWTFAPIALTVKPEFNYNWYNGYATQQPSEYLLNLEVQKQILHGMMTLSLKGYDLLGQAKNLTVTDTANYHTETVNNTLGRYIVMSLTVRFGSFKGHGGPGGPHGMGGGPRGR